MERYARQELLDGWNQDKINSSKTLIVGVGALGNSVAMNLVMAGAGVYLVDFDTIEKSNLSRQPLYKESDIGRSKVEVASERLKELNPYASVEFYFGRIALFLNENRNIINTFNVVADCLDNLENRLFVNQKCVESSTPLVSGGLYGFNGQLQVVTKDTACLECNPYIANRQVMGDSCSNEKTPSLAPVASLIGSMQAMEALKIIQGLTPVKEFVYYHGAAGIFQTALIKKKSRCKSCSGGTKNGNIPNKIS